MPNPIFCPHCDNEYFTYLLFQWDVAKAWRLIRTGKLKPLLDSVNIVPFAEGLLGLSRTGAQRITLLGTRVEMDKVKALPLEVLDIPGIIVRARWEEDPFAVVVDGNHRLARRYLDGHDDMNFYIFNEGEDRSFRTRTPRTRKGRK